MSPRSVSLQVALMKPHDLHHRYQIPFRKAIEVQALNAKNLSPEEALKAAKEASLAAEAAVTGRRPSQLVRDAEKLQEKRRFEAKVKEELRRLEKMRVDRLTDACINTCRLPGF
ncbi:unnamed protein product [Protopolystoma xenopodis]|uniref:Uncharacterized protein n=1 Tax=Protopolystoma xenopodis TaxID=117903 RepID=A0A3S5A993_9PLAT|nr:unnamed protein product [Protopolystoma xenopodis]